MSSTLSDVLNAAAEKLSRNQDFNKRDAIKAAREQLARALQSRGHIDQSLLQEVIWELHNEILAARDVSEREKAARAFFTEYSVKWAALRMANERAMHACHSEDPQADKLLNEFYCIRNQVYEWLEQTMPSEIPEILRGAYLEGVGDYNSAFWGRT